MSPVKRKNRAARKSSPPADLVPASAATARAEPLASPERAPAVTVEETAESSPSVVLTEVADQLHSAAIHLLRRLRVRDRESGIGPAQLSALSVLVFGGARSLGELADAEQVRPPTMSRIVAGLQRSRLVRRHATEDGRRVRLEATPKGVSLMWEGRKRRVESLAKALAALPENDREQLRGALKLLQQVVGDL
ncbi:MAG TPA: MarR family transcriptional regulator [Candidatus Cybelea sp.]|jgi:DNA-binding MarR family transcriptional regulator|nr:MarR family transcriptional regulator [Candidatus Cybelea sp.]